MWVHLYTEFEETTSNKLLNVVNETIMYYTLINQTDQKNQNDQNNQSDRSYYIE